MKNSNAALELDSHEADPLAPTPLDLSKAVRGKYFDRMQEGTNIILLAADLAETFPDSDSVNEALRSLKAVADKQPAAPEGCSTGTPPLLAFHTQNLDQFQD